MIDWSPATKLLKEGHAAEAQAWLQARLDDNADAQGWFLLGVAAQLQDNAPLAERAYQHSIALNGQVIASRHNLAVVQHFLHKFREAEATARSLIEIAPGEVGAHKVLAQVLAAMERWEESLEACETATLLAPTDVEIREFYWSLLWTTSRIARVWWRVEHCLWREDAASLVQHNVYRYVAARNLGCDAFTVPVDLRELAEVPEPLRRRLASLLAFAELNTGDWAGALRLLELRDIPWQAPPPLESGLHHAYVSLGLGNWDTGWGDYRHRPTGLDQLPEIGRHGEIPLWEGQPIEGKRLLVLGEQGLGDVIMCARFLPLLSERCAEVQLNLSPAMARLVGEQEADTDRTEEVLVSERRPDYQIRMMDLMGALDVTPEHVPADVPYLQVDPARRARWQKRLEHLDGVRIGLVWAGNPNHRADLMRSAAQADFLPLLALPGVSWVSLQIGYAATQQEAELRDLPNWTSLHTEIADLQDTAALVEQLDLVITVDSLVAHLAGALGRPVWTMLATEGQDWRWLTGREDTPWYPTMRLLRKPVRGTWGTFIRNTVRDELARYLLMQTVRPVGNIERALLETWFATEGKDYPGLTLAPEMWSPVIWRFVHAMVVERQQPTWRDGLRKVADRSVGMIRAGALAILCRVDDSLRPSLYEIARMEGLPHWVYRVAIQQAADNSDQALWDALAATALRNYPDSGEINCRVAQLHRNRENIPEARELFSKLLVVHPRDPRLHRGLGLCALAKGDGLLALDSLEKAARLEPTQATYWYELGMVALGIGAFELAVAALQQARSLGGDHPGCYLFLTKAAAESGQPELARWALQELRRILFEKRRSPEELQDWLVYLHTAGWDSEAEADAIVPEAWIGEAYRQEKQAAIGSMGLLRHGNPAGWAMYVEHFPPRNPPAIPLWDNRSKSGRILVYRDQGMGDVIQAARLLPVLLGDYPYTLQAGSDLAPLLSLQDWAKRVTILDTNKIEEVDPVGYDAAAALMQTYARLNAEGFSPSLPVPYLTVPEEHRAPWREGLASVPGLKVGIIWAGNPLHKANHFRSTFLKSWLPIAAVPGVTLVSLQKDLPSNQALDLPEIPLINAAAQCDSLLQTAAAIMELDLVISVDSGVAHLAGALGKPVWILLPAFGTDWRWGLAGETTNLYPTARLFRQQSGAEPWSGVLQRVAQALAELVAQQSKS